MNFVFPAAFFLGALAAPIVALYLRRPRRREVTVPSLLLWRTVLSRDPRRRFLGRLRNPLSLLLQLAILAALLFALARPQARRPFGRQSTVLIVDARARMQAHGVFPAAVRAAGEVVSQAGSEDETAVLAVEGAPIIVSPFSSDQKSLRHALAGITVSDAGGGMEAAIELGRRLLASRPGAKRLVVISDREGGGGVEWIAVGRPADNVAFVALAQKAVPASPQTVEVFAKLQNFSPQAREIEFEFLLDGRPIDLQKLPVAAGSERDFTTVLPAGMESNGLLTARLTGRDALGVDDIARVVIGPARPIRVLLITADNPFLEGALKADPGISLEILRPESWNPALAGGFDAVIFDNWLPQDASAEILATGNFLFFGRTPFDRPGEPAAADPIEMAAESPLIRNVDGLEPGPSRRLQMPDDPRVRAGEVMSCAGEPVALALERIGGTRSLALGFSAGGSRLPLRASFPIFVSNAVHWLAGREGKDDSLRKAGETFVPTDGASIAMMPEDEPPPSGRVPPMTERPLRLRKNGFYTVREHDRTRTVAVNTADAAEGDLRQAGPSGGTRAPAPGWPALPPWRLLALGGFVLLVAEWMLHHRRATE